VLEQGERALATLAAGLGTYALRGA
jgi:hypothetical protein